MNRRQYLAITTAGLVSVAGCIGTPAQSSTIPTPSISISQTESTPPDTAIDVSVLDEFTDVDPAHIAITYTNEGSHRRTVSFGASPPFSQYFSQSGELVILPSHHTHLQPENAQNLIPRSPRDGCWRAPSFINFIAGRSVTLEPGASITERYTVLASPESTHCLSAGVYRFVEPNYFENGPQWGFSLRMTN